MSEHTEPEVASEQPEQATLAEAKPKTKITVKTSDVIAIAAIVAVIVGLSVFTTNKLILKHEVSQAEAAVASKAVTDLSKQNTKALRLLGDSTFQAKNSASSLDTHLTASDPNGQPITFAQLYGDATPSLDMRIVTNNARGKHVVFVYKYTKLKAPLYVRIDTIQPNGKSKWYLQALTVGTDETALTTASNN